MNQDGARLVLLALIGLLTVAGIGTVIYDTCRRRRMIEHPLGRTPEANSLNKLEVALFIVDRSKRTWEASRRPNRGLLAPERDLVAASSVWFLSQASGLDLRGARQQQGSAA